MQFIQYVLLHVYMSVNVNGMYMYMNKRVEFAQRGTVLSKILCIINNNG